MRCLSKLPKLSESPAEAAEEGLQTEKEKKRSKAEKGRGGGNAREGKEKYKVAGREDEFSLLQDPPKHVPALS